MLGELYPPMQKAKDWNIIGLSQMEQSVQKGCIISKMSTTITVGLQRFNGVATKYLDII
jgi:hypothetical protein